MITIKYSAGDKESDELGEPRGTPTKESRSARRDAQRRTRRPFDKPPPPGHPPHIRTMAMSPTPATSRAIARKGGIDDPKGAQARSTARLDPTSHATQSS